MSKEGISNEKILLDNLCCNRITNCTSANRIPIDYRYGTNGLIRNCNHYYKCFLILHKEKTMIFYTDQVMKNIPEDVTVVAATKYFTAEEMRQLYHTGIHHFGENRVEVFLEKQIALQDLDITWHFIGTLQTKKTKKIIDKIDFLHSLDSIKLAEEIDKRRTSPLNCFVQVNISNEESKHGLNENDVIPFIKDVLSYKNIKIIGLMGMAEFTQDQSLIDEEFNRINVIKDAINKELQLHLTELSIGMSNDYLSAIKHNATYLRLGSVLFRRDE